MKRIALLLAPFAFLVIGILSAQPAHATPGCETIPWGFLGYQKRTICDGPLRADGSWDRERTIWTPAHNTPFQCYYGRYTSTCYGGYFVDLTIQEDMSYPVTPDTVLPNEPGHLG